MRNWTPTLLFAAAATILSSSAVAEEAEPKPRRAVAEVPT